MNLLCKKIICEKSFYQVTSGYAWADSSLRRWLNTEFYHTFSEKERADIILSRRNSLLDYVYLLNIDEAERIEQHILSCGAWWWLRSLGANVDLIAGVYSDGSLDYDGESQYKKGGVRPAITVKSVAE